MTKTLLAFLLLYAITASASTTETLKTVANIEETNAVFVELSRRSGLEKAELKSLLADCSASQQSMYFCAWRDQIEANQKLGLILAERAQKSPKCKPTLKSKVSRWEQMRDQSCNKSAKRQWGEGSMKPTAEAMCIAAETERMIKRLDAAHGCNIR